MREKEKREIIIQAIASEREKLEKGQFPADSITLCPFDKNQSVLQKMTIDEFRQILNKLESEEHVLAIRQVLPLEGIQTIDEEPYEVPWSRPDIFFIDLTEDFVPWYKAHQKNKNITLSTLSKKTLKSTLTFLEEIEDPLAVNKSHALTLKTAGAIPIPDDTIINLLLNTDVLLGCTHVTDGIKIKVDIDRYGTFKQDLKEQLPQQNETQVSSQRANITSPFPPVKQWEDIAIQFKNGQDVIVKIGNSSIRSDFKQMGFEDLRTRRPDTQWILLQNLSQSQGNKSWQNGPQSKPKVSAAKLTYDDLPDEEGASDPGFSIVKAANSERKHKQLLAKQLKLLFGLKQDPFWPYTKDGGYQIRIHLTPF